MTRRCWLALAVLACAVVLLNACKALTVDDSVYYLYARHIARQPLDPYGFELVPGQQANWVLAPPGFLYWWAGSLRLFGERPFLWKLSLLPFVLLLTVSLAVLARRCARGLEGALVCFVVGSPVILPCLNLMLDVPALALSLAALVLFLKACDRDGALLAILAGLLAGLAVQTKYTGATAPAVMLAYALLHGRARLGLLAAVPARAGSVSDGHGVGRR
jgi:4-amino-4-deoxy-L-arabinose transferase-like glycosyltransferase